ncbi:acyl carrier protein [Agrobacterium rhizogenes]|nr:acyl carrier protein [Rhizobium rhizogenes]
MHEDDILRFLRDDLSVDTTSINSKSQLISSGIIDSFSLIGLVMFLEEKAGVMAEPEDVTIENFETIEAMLHFIERKSVEA